MPMIPASLQSDLEEIYSSESRTPDEAANMYASAIVSLWESAMAPGAGSVTAAQVRGAVFSGVQSAWSTNNNNSLVAANGIANALNGALAGVIISGGTYGAGPCTPLGLAALMADLIDIYGSITDNPSLAAQKEAIAIVNFSKATLCFGTGVESPPIPKIGPLS